ncbi:hypothetical protein ACQ4PT_001157 [Festuca glaucescens]
MSSEQPAAEAAEASVSPPKESPGGGAGGGGAAPPAAAHETNALWVGNLPTHAGDADVMAAFAPHGALDCALSRAGARSYAFVLFRSLAESRAALEALRGSKVKGSEIRIDFARPARAVRNLWIGGISSSVSKQQLEEELQKFGKIEGIAFSHDQTSAYIDFEKLDDAISAHRALNGTDLGGKELCVDFQRSRGKAENSQFMYEENEYGMSEEEGSDDSADYKPKRHKRKNANELLKPDEIVEQIDSRSIAVSPLPYNVKMEDVQSFFAQHGKVNSVMLPRHVLDKRLFCGTAVVEFSEEEEANSVLEKKLNFAGADLDVKHKKEFDTEREAKQEAFEKSKQEGYEKSTTNNDGRNEGYPKGLILAFKLSKILADKVDTAKKEEDSSSAKEWAIDHEEKVFENADHEEKSDDVVADTQPPNKDGTSPSENDNQTITREDLQEYFAKFGTVRYVDISKRRDSGHIRFKGSKVEEKACALAALQHEGGLILKGHLVTLESLPVSSHKEILQAFSLKKYQQFPAYRTILEGGPSDLKFGCTVELDGQLFRSAQLHLRKKEAEQDAAKVAYEFLLARRGDNFADVEGLIEKDLLLAKSILYEFSSKKKIDQPLYNFQRKKGPAKMFFFAATVSIDGKEYTGGMAKSKSAAAESAARLAAKLILDTNDECMLHVFRSKKKIVTATRSGSEKEVPGSEWRCADTPGLVMVKNRWTALESPAATSSGSADRLKLPPCTDAGSSSALAP